ncbi:MAG: nucleoside 2-deoxyribosyltransferase [Thermoflexales bacterium]|nr:nucleoside 2-deoxyribosyltransferase [Thermoflexales bacterium]
MDVYFSASIAGGRDNMPVFQYIVRALQAAGHTVPTTHVADPDVLAGEARLAERAIYERDVAWVHGCDAMVAEVSTPSLGVGYEIALAVQLGKPVLCLYRQDLFVSRMITGNPHIQVQSYRSVEEIDACLARFLAEWEKRET